jgi:hypothetical protein
MDRIIAHADIKALHALRATSRAYLAHIEALLCARQAIVYATQGHGELVFRAPHTQGIPRFYGTRLARLTPRLRARLAHVRAIELHAADNGALLPALQLMPAAVVRLPARLVRSLNPVPTAAVFSDHPHQPMAPKCWRLIINMHSHRCASFTQPGPVRELVVNFARLAPPEQPACLSSHEYADFLHTLEGYREASITLVEYERYCAWMGPCSCGTRRGWDPVARRGVFCACVARWFPPSRGFGGVRFLSSAEYAAEVGPERYAAEAEWSDIGVKPVPLRFSAAQ